MQFYSNSKRLSKKTFFFLLAFVFIAYLPISSFLFFLKNDAFTGYFPPKFFMSEALGEGILPLWNPYINFGIPQYGDMSSGFWSPITWVIASTVGYNAYTFTLEVMLYLFLAGLGMYVLCRQYKLMPVVCLIAGASYMCSGYMVGHMQHFNWISGAAFLPWAFYAYRELLYKLNLKNVLIAALFIYTLIASAHPGITLGTVYFFAAYAVFHFLAGEPGARISGLLKTHFLLTLAVLILSAGLIIGYADILPHFTRAEKPAAAAIVNPSNVKSWLSFLLPMSTVKNDTWFSTDISMRNLYMGLSLLLFLCLTLVHKKTREQLFFLLLGLFFLVLATGGLLSRLLYNLPLLGYVRLPGEYIIFSILAFILVASVTLNRFIQDDKIYTRLSFLIKLFFIAFVVMVGWAFIQIFTTHDSLIYKLSSLNEATGLTPKMKMLVDNLSFYDSVFFQGIIQLTLLLFLFNAIKAKQYSRLLYIVSIDLIIATLLNLPFTAAGQSSLKNVQQIINASPAGIPVPSMDPIQNNDTGSMAQTAIIGHWSFYNKQPGTTSMAFYPIELNTTKSIFSAANQQNFLNPLVFSTNKNRDISIEKYSAQQISIRVVAQAADTLVWQQSFYPHWKVYVDNIPVPVIAYRNIYQAVSISPGNHIVKFKFEPNRIKFAMILSAIAIVLSVIYLAIIWIFPSWPPKRLRP